MDFFLPIASAASTSLLDPSVPYTTSDMIRIAISLIVVVALVCAVVFTIWWGLMLILSGGKNDKVSTAIGTIRYSVIGVVVIVIAIFLIPRVAEILGFSSFDYLSPESIFQTVKMLMARVFGWSATTTDSFEF